jgi:drug/metabolite transporter (DMT)-like permease
LRGYVFFAAATFLWGVSAVLGRAVFTAKFSLAGETQHPIDPLILSQTRTSFSLLVLLPLLAARGGWKRIHLPSADLLQSLILGMLGVAASNYFYYVAIQKTSVAIAIILQ